MKIVVVVKMVPDVVEELEIAADGRSLDTDFVRFIINERDEHALEQAIILKERCGGEVAVVALDAPEVDDVLFTALAKGADRVVKVEDGQENLSTVELAHTIGATLPTIPDLLPADLVLTGVQATDDLDAMLAPYLAHQLGYAYLGIVTEITPEEEGGVVRVVKEFPGGYRGVYLSSLPAVLGVQAAETPPRYVPVAKVRAAMKERSIETVPAAQVPGDISHLQAEVEKMAKPEVTTHAEMLEGKPEEIAARICDLLTQRSLL